MPSIQECESLLASLVKTNTCQPEGNEAQAVRLVLGMIPKGLETHVLHDAPGRDSLVIRVPGLEKEGALAFLGHLDDVALGAAAWSVPPLDALVRDGVMYGRGSCDMKGGDVAMILALRHLAATGRMPAHTVYFVFTSDEERDGLGVRHVARSGLLDHVTQVIVCEPTSGRLARCEKGALGLHGIVRGKQSHGAYPEEGANAIDYGYKLIAEARSLIDTATRHPLLGQASLSPTGFSAGGAPNIVPGVADILLDIRTLPGTDHAGLVAAIRAAADGIHRQNPLVAFDISATNDRMAIETPPGDPLLEDLRDICGKIGLSQEDSGVYFYTDASLLMPSLPNASCVLAGPGESTLMHTTDEHIELQSVAQFTDLYTRFLDQRMA